MCPLTCSLLSRACSLRSRLFSLLLLALLPAPGTERKLVVLHTIREEEVHTEIHHTFLGMIGEYSNPSCPAHFRF